jgi:replicative DNA helicase
MQVLDEVERDVLRISEERVESNTRTIKDLVRRAIVTIEEFHQRQGMLTGWGPGFPDLDKMTTGLHGGEMVVIAARPSVGKTSLAMNIVRACGGRGTAAGGGVQPGDDGGIAGVADVVFPVAREPAERAGGFLAERDFPKLTGSAGKLASAPLVHRGHVGVIDLQLRAKARRLHSQYGIKLIVVDYLQLLHSTARRAENRQQEIADISNGIKALAKGIECADHRPEPAQSRGRTRPSRAAVVGSA